jgi:hypothetical protein
LKFNWPLQAARQITSRLPPTEKFRRIYELKNLPVFKYFDRFVFESIGFPDKFKTRRREVCELKVYAISPPPK